MTDNRKDQVERLATDANRKYGQKTAFTVKNPYLQRAVPSGSLMFDYMSGLGGHPRGAFSEIYGIPAIGKTSLMGYGALRNAQAMDLITGIIAVEPAYDDAWVAKNGINPDYNVTAFPDNIDEGFDILHDWVYDGTIDYILFDSLVGASTEADQEPGAKARPGGLAKTITWNLQRLVTRCMKNDVGVMFINQVRDDQKARIPGMLDAPGGWALKHFALNRVQVKPGKGRYMLKVDGEDQQVGREVVCSFKKAKAHNAIGRVAKFDYYFIDTDGEYPFGIDVAQDVINTAKLTKVFEPKGSWLWHPIFPNGKLNGKDAVSEWLKERPEALAKIREEVLDKMVEAKANLKPELTAIDGG